MESGVNADQNFYSQRAARSPSNPPQLHELDSRSPQRPPKLSFLTQQNLQAVTANGYVGAALTGGSDPDDFYRDYRGVQQSPNGFPDLPTNGMPTASEARFAPSSLRSNSNGTTPKHPSLPGTRNGLKSSYRSASSPLDNQSTLDPTKSLTSPALNGCGHARQPPSVKDLLKRFDQNNEQPSSSARKPVATIGTKDSGGLGYAGDRVGVGYQARTTSSNQSAGTLRAGVSTRDATPGRGKPPSNTRPTQRTRFASEDQHSNNTLSVTARTTRTRTAAAGNISQASKSMTHLSPATPPSQNPARIPLFGEVLHAGQALPEIGHGIPRAASRRTSESSLVPLWNYNRSRTDSNVSPSSPTAWYLGVTPALDDVNPNKSRSALGHNRNHSDFADMRVNTMTGVEPSFESASSPLSSPAHHISRLPVASKRSSNASESSSVASTRSNSRASSPRTIQPTSNGRYHKNESRPWSPVGRVVPLTPIKSTGSPARQVTHGRMRTPERPTPNNASLKAYISAPLPKTSPPLRSSRPRKPISSASTPDSRPKSDRSGSPRQAPTGMKITRKGGSDREKSKKPKDQAIEDSLVDFAERRAKIQRAYTKSIQESEQRQIRADNWRRLQERKARNSTLAAGKIDPDEDAVAMTPDPTPLDYNPTDHLHIDTSFQRNENEGELAANDQDSPTLGMPGTFVEDVEAPYSAISTATGTTDIENEPQTEAPHLSRMAPDARSSSHRLSSQVLFNEDQFSPEQAAYGIRHDNDDESIEIMLDATPVEESQPESTPTHDIFNRDQDPLLPGSFRESNFEHSVPPRFTTTITSASPKESTPVNSRPTTPPQYRDNTGIPNRDITNIHDRVTGNYGRDHETSRAPEIRLPGADGLEFDSDSRGPPSSQLPDLRAALEVQSLAGSDVAQDGLHTPVTDMDYDSSDSAEPPVASEEGSRLIPGPSRVLQAPTPSQRSSHQSSWTDYSIESIDSLPSQDFDSEVHLSGASSGKDLERKPTPPPKGESAPSSLALPQPSPGFLTNKSFAGHSRNHLPPLRTGDDFGLGFSDHAPKTSGVNWPDLSSPPPTFLQQSDEASARSSRSPPLPSVHHRRPPSSLYQSSHNDTSRTKESRRASDDFYSSHASTSTPRSSTQISLEDVTVSQLSDPKNTAVENDGDTKATEKARKRLFHRKMLIKELIETEAVYLKDMNVVEEIYKGTAEACPKLDSNDINIIFRNTAEIVAFSTNLLDELKSAASSVWSPRQKSRPRKSSVATDDRSSIAVTLAEETEEQKDSKTFIGANFGKHLKKMQLIYTDFLKNSELANTRLAALQVDAAVKVWLSECNLVAKDLTQAWDLDALLVKPVQRITRYQLLLKDIYEQTTEEHPDYQALGNTVDEIASLLKNIDEMKKRIHMVGKIVGRKRKESDVRSGLAKAFGRRTEKLQSSANRPPDDEIYVKLNEKFGDDYLRLQVVLRDVEFYTRQCTTYVNDFLRYLSAMELIMRMSASPYPELESKWARFNMSMRDMGTIALEDHISAVRQKVIEPFEQVIQLYGPPGLAMKKRSKRRLDYERYLVAKSTGKKVDEKLSELTEQYEALNETLKLELPKLAARTEQIGSICMVQFVHIQAQWYKIWQEKVRIVLEDTQIPKDIEEIVDMFTRDFKYVDARAQELGIVNGTFDSGENARASQSTQDDDASLKVKGRPSNLSSRSRGMSLTSEQSPSLPTPDFVKRHSGQFTFSPITTTTPDLPPITYSSQAWSSHSRPGSGSPGTPDLGSTSRPHASSLARPGTSRSFTSDSGVPRLSTDYMPSTRRESGSTHNSTSQHVDGPPPPSHRPFSGLFQSALPDGPEHSQKSSRASSGDRSGGNRFNVLYLAASLFEFNISATKSEAGYPYLTYQAGEIFDVIGEKGELWLAKNQDDPREIVGWIWSKHFARLATD